MRIAERAHELVEVRSEPLVQGVVGLDEQIADIRRMPGHALPARPGRFDGPRPVFADVPDRPWLRQVALHPLVWVQCDDTRITVPIGYVFDGATIPRFAWSIVGHPFMHDVVRAACVHDFECDTRLGRSRDAHRRFEYAMQADGVGWARRRLMYVSVRTFGPRW